MSIELAKRAVACKAWRWLPGMKVEHEDYWIDREDAGQLSDAGGDDLPDRDWET